MSLSDDIANDFSSLWEELQCRVFIGEANKDIRALVTNITHELEFELGGFEGRNNLEVRVLRSDLKVFPKIGGVLQFEGDNYRISSIIGKQSFPILTLQCQQK